MDDQGGLHRSDRHADVNGCRTEHPADKGVEQYDGKFFDCHGILLVFC